jgi:hypothetical protein
MSMLVQCAKITHVGESTTEDEPKLNCLPSLLSPCTNMSPSETTWPEVVRSVLTAQRGLGVDPSSIDDEKDLSDCSMLLVNDENTHYRDTLSCQKTAHAAGQALHALSPIARAVIKWLNEGLPGSMACIPPSLINALVHEACNPLECGLMAHMTDQIHMAMMRMNASCSSPYAAIHPDETLMPRHQIC